MLILSALYFLSRFTGLLQAQLISALMPTVATDAYSVAFDLPDYLNYLVAGGAISLTFIPIFTRFWEKGKEAEAWRFFSTLMCTMGAFLFVATALMMIFTPQFMALTKPGFLGPDENGLLDPNGREKFELAVQMTRVILPAQFFFYSGGLMLGVLNAFKRFGSSGWTSAVYNLVAIAIAVPLWLLTKNPVVFAWGILIGAFFGNFLLPYLALQAAPRSQRPRFRVLLDTKNPAVRRFFVLTLPIMLGVSLPVVDWWVVGYFGSSLGDGPLTHMKNANRLMISAQGIVGQAVAVASFPFLASMIALGNYAEFSDFLRTTLRRLTFVTLPLSVLLVLGATPLCSLVWGWGKYDDPAKIGETAVSFAFFTIGLFAWAAQGFGLARVLRAGRHAHANDHRLAADNFLFHSALRCFHALQNGRTGPFARHDNRRGGLFRRGANLPGKQIETPQIQRADGSGTAGGHIIAHDVGVRPDGRGWWHGAVAR